MFYAKIEKKIINTFLVRELRDELSALQETGSSVGEVVKVMGTEKVLVKINPEGKYIVNVDKGINMEELKPNTRVGNYIHKIKLNQNSFEIG